MEPRWLTDEEQRAWRAYLAGNQRLTERLNRDLAPFDLSLADYRILVMLSEAPRMALRMSELADGVLSSRSRLTHQIRRLESDGLVTRSNCEEDGRGVRAHLTDEGMAKLREAAPAHVDSVRSGFVDLLTPEDLRTVARIFAKVDAASGDAAS